MSTKKTKKNWTKGVTKSLDPTRDKYDPELDKLQDKIVVNPEKLARVNELLEKTPIPQWILDL